MIHDKKIVTDTKVGVRKVVAPQHLEGLVMKTTGDAARMPVLAGIITQTTRGAGGVKDSVMKHDGYDVKTQPKRYGQVPYAGKKY